ncbi:MAG: ComF family protein [Candidatus Omnitrophota bacterium]
MLRSFFSGLRDILYPKICLACKDKLKPKAADELVCGKCWDNIKRNVPPFCSRCGRHLAKNNITKSVCPACVRKVLHFDRAYSPAVYAGPLKELIHEFKYKNKDYLGGTLSKLISEFIKEYKIPLELIDYIMPVPLHQARLRQREFNQAQVLSRHIAEEFDKTMLENVLIRHKNTRTQTELEPQLRLSNVLGSFSVKNAAAINRRNILLIDDVLTTGATCSEAALALKNAGAGIVFALTLAN